MKGAFTSASLVILSVTAIYGLPTTDVLAFLNSTVNSGPSGCTAGDNSFDYLLLVQQWPATQQSTTWPPGAVLDDFTLHGLWPSRIGANVASYPCTCTSEAFSESEVPASLDEMKAHWPSYTGQNDVFWGHEWSKHGTCCDTTPGVNSQADFFASALSMRDKSGILAAFNTSGIVPGASYSFDKMAQAVKSAIGVNPTMGCKTGNTLSEIALCFTKDLQLQECDPSVSSQPGDEVSDCDQTVDIVFPSYGPSPSPSPTGTCKQQGCKFTAGAPCQCNSNCAQYDDCCPDFSKICPPSPAPSPSPPSPSPSPSPSGGQCVPGVHGPACTADADCTSVTGCVRCAKSGFCTDVPLSGFW